mmetsp:Transcript_16037/g.48729  ORF Transcript_16037/g.48729 Transcript_16037/m.48729 type:complete len:81 (+) Transcript_16037:191-433(+)
MHCTTQGVFHKAPEETLKSCGTLTVPESHMEEHSPLGASSTGLLSCWHRSKASALPPITPNNAYWAARQHARPITKATPK